jgi:hypothetical protein
MLENPSPIPDKDPPPPPGKHHWERTIIGYKAQSEPQWVTSFGYRPPITQYRCKRCEKTIADESIFFIVGMTLDGPCNGSEE